MRTTVVKVNGQQFEVPVSAKGTATGTDIIKTAGVENKQNIYWENEEGHEVVQPSDEITVTPGQEFYTIARFITA